MAYPSNSSRARGQSMGIYIALAVFVLLAPFSSLEARGMAEYVRIEEGAQAGDIIIIENDTYQKASREYDARIIGVVTENPAVGFGEQGKINTLPLVTSGTVLVNVSAANGNIEIGDHLTASEQPGIGMKATRPGVVLGVAREPFSPDTPDAIGQIPVRVNIHFASVEFEDAATMRQSIAQQIRRALTTGAMAAATEPNSALRYMFAILTTLISIGFGLFSFIRAANNGITAIGRNPLAQYSILVGIAFNVLLTIGIVAAGLALSFFILSA